MKKAIITLLCAATLGLTGCGLEDSLSSGQIKANLESKGYSAQVMSKTEAEARIEGVKYTVEITDAVYTSKGENEVFLAFVCKNINDASKFVEENIAAMNNYAQQYSDAIQVGSHNNVAYTGTKTAVGAAGIPVIQ